MGNNTSNLLIILVIAVAIWYYFKKKNEVIPDVPYPHGTSAVPANWNPNELADKLHEAMSSILILSTTKEAAWYQLYTLPNQESTIAVYNTFNKKYGREGKGTLTKWIDDSWYYNWNASVKQKLVAKLRAWNLK